MEDETVPDITEGSGRYVFDDPERPGQPGIPVWYHRPEGYTDTKPVVFVMHGMGRNADEYRDNWVAQSDARGFLVVAPEFAMEHFRDDWPYSLGNLAHEQDGKVVLNARKDWSLPIIDRIFADACRRAGSRRETFSLFGHSAGGQFVHRYMTFADTGLVDLAIAANPGFYTLPVRDEPFPYGLGGADVEDDAVARYFGRPLVILLGEADTEQGTSLRQTPEAMRQGPHRFARGKNYFSVARSEAERLGVPFNWRIESVHGVGHENAKLAGPAAAIIAAMAPK